MDTTAARWTDTAAQVTTGVRRVGGLHMMVEGGTQEGGPTEDSVGVGKGEELRWRATPRHGRPDRCPGQDSGDLGESCKTGDTEGRDKRPRSTQPTEAKNTE